MLILRVFTFPMTFQVNWDKPGSIVVGEVCKFKIPFVNMEKIS